MEPTFYARPVVEVAQALIGCTVTCGETGGVIVETEAYHESEPACHAFVGLTARTRTLFGPPGHAYVYRSYGLHALLNAVAEPAGVGAAVLIRALEPLTGLETMRLRRAANGVARLRDEDLCSGPGKLTQALGIVLDDNGGDLATGRVRIGPPAPGWENASFTAGPRIGITRAVELPWRFCAVGARSVSRPWPAGLRAPRARAPRPAAASN